VVNRGVAVWKGRVYVGTIDGRLVALDAKTGKVAWTQQTTDNSKPYTITGAPRIVKDKVLIGNGGAEYGVRGYISAYDAATGKLVWRFFTTPNPTGAADGAASVGRRVEADRRRRHGLGFHGLRSAARHHVLRDR
jgi:quinohemoprotein ethanol dehydrogenase